MTPSATPLLAIQVDGVEFALEPGRTYALGSHAHCDLRLCAVDAAPIAVRVSLGNGVAIVKPTGGRQHVLAPGDGMRIGGTELRVVVDSGAAVILAIPALRAARLEAQATGVVDAQSNLAEAAAVPPTSALPAVAPAPPTSGIAPAAPIPPSARGESFADLMAHELRRMPWLALSLAAHALLFLLLLWLFHTPPPGPPSTALYGFHGGQNAIESPAPPPPAPTVVPEPADQVSASELDVPTLRDVDDATAPLPDPTARNRSLLRIGQERVRGSSRPASGGGDVLAGAGVGTGAFRATVSDLRRTGLDVVFVIDSTGSMDRHIVACKEGIAAMLELMQALVPDARFAVVAYRDRGAEENYVVRTLPLSSDLWAAVNFVHSIEADGGGNVPEAVRDGLHAAFAQPWKSGSRRVVVLAGDAPPHAKDVRPLLDEVRKFSQTEGSFVHALVTETSRGVGEDPAISFRRIAERGRGVCLGVQDQHRLLQEVLALAFGREFAANLAAAQRAVDAARRSPPTWALAVARSGGEELARLLRADVVPSALVHALLRLPRREVMSQLATLLGREDTSAAGRQAASHVLHKTLTLSALPIEPAEPRAIGPSLVGQLRTAAEALPK